MAPSLCLEARPGGALGAGLAVRPGRPRRAALSRRSVRAPSPDGLRPGARSPPGRRALLSPPGRAAAQSLAIRPPASVPLCCRRAPGTPSVRGPVSPAGLPRNVGGGAPCARSPLRGLGAQSGAVAVPTARSPGQAGGSRTWGAPAGALSGGAEWRGAPLQGCTGRASPRPGARWSRGPLPSRALALAGFSQQTCGGPGRPEVLRSPKGGLSVAFSPCAQSRWEGATTPLSQLSPPRAQSRC